MACMFMADRHAIENMKRYPDQIEPYVQAEIKLAHTWKNKKSLAELWERCLDIDDTDEEQMEGQMSIADIPGIIP